MLKCEAILAFVLAGSDTKRQSCVYQTTLGSESQRHTTTGLYITQLTNTDAEIARHANYRLKYTD